MMFWMACAANGRRPVGRTTTHKQAAYPPGGMTMKITPSLTLMSLLIVSTAATSAEPVVEFDGGMGSQPFASVGGAVAPNDVRGVPPGGRPWEIRRLKATVFNDRGLARIVAKGEGLILNGGNATGTPAAPRTVAATLFCGTNTPFNSEAVPTNAAGDFEIRSPLTDPAGNMVLPDPCGTPAAPAILLIRNAPGGVPGAWFAAGIPKVNDDH
jgi:hypothetical protein